MQRNTLFLGLSAILAVLAGQSILKAASPYYPVRDFRTDQISYYTQGEKVSLFADDNLDQWTNAKGDPVGNGWVLKDGILSRTKSSGDIITKKEYEYFVFEFDWKIGPKGNSGVKYRVKKIGNSYLGCEYQLLDDLQSGERNLTASLYDIYAPNGNKPLKPLGEYNHTKIVVLGDRIEHWLNGERVLLVYSGTPDWKAHVAKSKFNEIDGFGENATGKLLIQDHGDEVHLKNMTVQEYIPVGTK